MDTEIKVTELPDFNAFRVDAVLPNGHSVGYINISLKGTISDICDLCVKDSYMYLWPNFMPVFLSIKRNRNYQNKGIGSRLLVTAIEHSKANGCTQMKGWIHGDKVRLERFYRSFPERYLVLVVFANREIENPNIEFEICKSTSTS